MHIAQVTPWPFFCSNKYCRAHVGAADMGAGGAWEGYASHNKTKIPKFGGRKSNTDGMAEMEVGALSERALRCLGEHPSASTSVGNS